ncbi:MAG: hypothetical protein JSV99_05195 [Planctomycetota bacterium]|nr:MAG: hypothetical protein JSV99_05195 [Planctomycetota bacterium]
MKAVAGAVPTLLFLFFAVVGCESAQPTAESAPRSDRASQEVAVYTGYSPVKVDILPLTELVGGSEEVKASSIKVYASLLDAFDSQIKSPTVFRFELYKKVQRSAEPKGKRITIWADIDLTEPGENNRYWRDFLRAYEFILDFEPTGKPDYILQVTCLCPDGKRLSAEFALSEAK